MSIATSILGIAEQEAKKNKAKKIKNINVRVGVLSGVLVDSLKFCFETAAKGTLAEKSELEVIETKAQAKCESCNETFETNLRVPECPVCKELVFHVTDGNDLHITGIKIDT
jgi:hydrogenase nickel incorporation protein HypA/HybF